MKLTTSPPNSAVHMFPDFRGGPEELTIYDFGRDIYRPATQADLDLYVCVANAQAAYRDGLHRLDSLMSAVCSGDMTLDEFRTRVRAIGGVPRWQS